MGIAIPRFEIFDMRKPHELDTDKHTKKQAGYGGVAHLGLVDDVGQARLKSIDLAVGTNLRSGQELE